MHRNYHLLKNNLFKEISLRVFYFNIDINRFLLKDSFLMGVEAKNHWNLPLLLSCLDCSTLCLSQKWVQVQFFIYYCGLPMN